MPDLAGKSDHGTAEDRTHFYGDGCCVCPLEPHDRGLRYDAEKDVAICPLCGHEQWEEMGG